MSRPTSSIVLIGMPGSGKSTVGVILAKMTARDFVDTDVLIQIACRRSLQEIIDADGPMALRRIEERVLVGLQRDHHVIATGGSAAYSDRAMRHLKRIGQVVFLDADLTTLAGRIRNFDSRGLAKRPDQSFADLFAERLPLYQRYADLTVVCSNLTQEAVCERIIAALARVSVPT